MKIKNNQVWLAMSGCSAVALHCVADRVLVVRNGRVGGILDGADATAAAVLAVEMASASEFTDISA